jgi:hypothetical protein
MRAEALVVERAIGEKGYRRGEGVFMSDTFGSKKEEEKGAEEKEILREQHVYMRFWLAYTGVYTSRFHCEY